MENKAIVNREIIEVAGMLFIREIYDDGSYKDTQVIPSEAEPKADPKKSCEEPKKENKGTKDKIKKGVAIGLAAVGGILLGKKLSSDNEDCGDENDYESIGSYNSSEEDEVPE